jgi:hypothetical protein
LVLEDLSPHKDFNDFKTAAQAAAWSIAAAMTLTNTIQQQTNDYALHQLLHRWWVDGSTRTQQLCPTLTQQPVKQHGGGTAATNKPSPSADGSTPCMFLPAGHGVDGIHAMARLVT